MARPIRGLVGTGVDEDSGDRWPGSRPGGRGEGTYTQHF